MITRFLNDEVSIWKGRRMRSLRAAVKKWSMRSFVGFVVLGRITPGSSVIKKPKGRIPHRQTPHFMYAVVRRRIVEFKPMGHDYLTIRKFDDPRRS